MEMSQAQFLKVKADSKMSTLIISLSAYNWLHNIVQVLNCRASTSWTVQLMIQQTPTLVTNWKKHQMKLTMMTTLIYQYQQMLLTSKVRSTAIVYN